jgi:hypothetical protein
MMIMMTEQDNLYTLLLIAAGPRKLDTITVLEREVRLSPRAALRIVQAAPAPVGPLTWDAATRLEAALTAAGAEVELLPAAAASARLAELQATLPHTAAASPPRTHAMALLRSAAVLCWIAGAVLLVFTVNGWPLAVGLFILGVLLLIPTRRSPVS